MEGADDVDARMDDAADAGPGAPAAPLEPLTLHILELIKTSQNEHGLRHGDYERYRAYCTKRVRRIRKSVGFLHGSKSRFSKRTLRADACTDARHLMIPLMNAERAWSLAMHLKRQSSGDLRPRHHMLHRLAKAARWATELHALCAERADKRTLLEAEAYAAWIVGTHALERESWASALRSFFRAQTIYSELSRVSLLGEQQLYREMADEIQPIARYARYELQMSGGGGKGAEAEGAGEADDELSIVDLLKDDSHNLASNLLRSKLEPMLADMQAKQAASLDQIVFRQQPIPVTNEKLRVSILRAQELMTQIRDAHAALRAAAPAADGADAAAPQPAGGKRARSRSEPLLQLYDQLLVEDNDALEIIRADSKAEARGGGAKPGGAAPRADASQLSALQTYFSVRKLRHTVRRHGVMLLDMRERVGGTARADAAAPSGGAAPGTGGRLVTAEDIARVYAVVLECLGETGALLDAHEDAPDLLALELAATSAKAHRCFYLALSCMGAARWAHARALLDRADEHMATAEQQLEQVTAPAPLFPAEEMEAERAALETLHTEVAGARCRLRASALLQRVQAQQPEGLPASRLEQLTLANAPSGRGGGQPSPHVLDDLGLWACTALAPAAQAGGAGPEFHLIQLPPPFEAVACKPLLFDVARNTAARLPDVSALKRQERRGGLLSRIWGRG